MRFFKRGQSIFEYILFITVVIVILLALLGPNGIFKEKFETSLDLALNTLNGVVNTINYYGR